LQLSVVHVKKCKLINLESVKKEEFFRIYQKGNVNNGCQIILARDSEIAWGRLQVYNEKIATIS
jgi:hypothetical protein